MIENYLLENGERITNPSQLVEGEIYAIGSGKEGYRGFVMRKDKLGVDNFGDPELRIMTYHVPSRVDKGEIEISKIVFDPITMKYLGVISVNRGSEMRKSIEEGLGIVSEKSEERDPKLVAAS